MRPNRRDPADPRHRNVLVSSLPIVGLLAAACAGDRTSVVANGKEGVLWFDAPGETFYAAPGRFEVVVGRFLARHDDCGGFGDCAGSEFEREPLAREAEVGMDPALATLVGRWVDEDGALHVVFSPTADGDAELFVRSGELADRFPIAVRSPARISLSSEEPLSGGSLILVGTRVHGRLHLLDAEGAAAVEGGQFAGFYFLYSAEPLTWDAGNGRTLVSFQTDPDPDPSIESLAGTPWQDSPTSPHVVIEALAPGGATVRLGYPPAGLAQDLKLEVVDDELVAAGTLSPSSFACAPGPTAHDFAVRLTDTGGQRIHGGAARFVSGDPAIAEVVPIGNYHDRVHVVCHTPGTTSIAATFGAVTLAVGVTVTP